MKGTDWHCWAQTMTVHEKGKGTPPKFQSGLGVGLSQNAHWAVSTLHSRKASTPRSVGVV